MSENTRTCQVKVSTPFIFNSPAYQTSSEVTYEYVKAYSTFYGGTGKTYQFKTDAERMNYIIGQAGLFARGRR